MTRAMVQSVLSLSEYNRFSKGIFAWVGYRTKWIEYENVKRVDGETKWSFWKLLKYSIDGIVNFSNVPLMISSYLGIVMTFVSFLAIIIENGVKVSKIKCFQFVQQTLFKYNIFYYSNVFYQFLLVILFSLLILNPKNQHTMLPSHIPFLHDM